MVNVCLACRRANVTRRRCRFGFETFALTVAAIYSFGMYIFHSGVPAETLNGDDKAKLSRVNVNGYNLAIQRGDAGRPIREDDIKTAFDILQQQAAKMWHLPRVGLDTDGKRANGTKPRRTKTVRRLNEADQFVPPDANIHENCRKYATLADKASEYDFVKISPDAWVYSAYYDSRPNDFDNKHKGNFVRVMSVAQSKELDEVDCIFTDSDSGMTTVVPATYYEMCEMFNKTYRGYILSCAVPDVVEEPPCFVQIAARRSATASARLRLRMLQKIARQRDFTICVPPLFGAINLRRIVEFMEVSNVFGAGHVVFYDFNIPEDVRTVLDYYADERALAEIHRWQLPSDVDSEIWYHGQLIAIQDCLYRNMATSRYVVFNDIDEFIVPHNHTNWTAMVEHLDRPDQCAFQFAMALFDPNRPNSQMSKERVLSLKVLERSWYNTLSTKFMVKPDWVFEMGIHHVSKPIWAHLVVTVISPDVALLHHYRSCGGPTNMACLMYYKEESMLKYKKRILDAFSSAESDLQGLLTNSS